MEISNDTGRWSQVAAEELAAALDRTGIHTHLVRGDDGLVDVIFETVMDAETLMVLAVDPNGGPGSFYDRATSGCVTISSDVDEYLSEADIQELVESTWTWMVHPTLNGRRVEWHVRVEFPVADANQLTANLNAMRMGGIL